MYKRHRYNKRNCGCMNNQSQRNCPNCNVPDFMPENPQLAKAYVPYQELDDTFCPEEALKHGTAYPELVSPYCKNQSQKVIKYLKGTKTCVEVDENE